MTKKIIRFVLAWLVMPLLPFSLSIVLICEAAEWLGNDDAENCFKTSRELFDAWWKWASFK